MMGGTSSLGEAVSPGSLPVFPSLWLPITLSMAGMSVQESRGIQRLPGALLAG